MDSSGSLLTARQLAVAVLNETVARVESISKHLVEGTKTPFIIDRPEVGALEGMVRGLTNRLDAIEAKLESRTKGG